jgi:hypothetical protein
MAFARPSPITTSRETRPQSSAFASFKPERRLQVEMTMSDPWEGRDEFNEAPTGAKIENPNHVREFTLAGNAHLTIVSAKTGTRFTYQIRSTPPNADGKESPVSHFVALLTEPDNTHGYKYIGHVFRFSDYTHGKKSNIAWDAPGARAFRWFWDQVVVQGKTPAEAELECWHEGRCAACGRRLTVPESIERGIGPECYSKRNGA